MNAIVMAAMEEELALVRRGDARICPVVSGVGKVNAAVALERTLSDIYNIWQRHVIVVGTAGAADPALEIGDVVVATDAVFHDVDVTALGFPTGQIPFEETWRWQSDPQIRERAVHIAQRLGHRVVEGTIASGDRFVGDPDQVAWIRLTFGASCVEMETAAVALACHKPRKPTSPHPLNVTWTGIRIISDRADRSAPIDFPTFLPRAAETIGNIVHELVNHLG